MFKTGRYSPSSVAQDLSEQGSPPRFLGEVSKSFSRSTDSHDGFCSIATQESKTYTPSVVSAPPPCGKCRLLPCRTFISTGSCCYGDKCVFLHDQGVVSKPVYVKYLKKSKEDMSPDAFFWPMMPAQMVKSKLDNKNQPDINQAYLIPAPYVHPSNPNLSSNMNHFAVYSMWEHFVDFIAADSLSVVINPRPVHTSCPFQYINPYTGRKRMKAFIQLSAGQSVDKEEVNMEEVIVNAVLSDD